MDYIPRHITPVLTNAANTFCAIMLTGPRQVGKTTLLSHAFPDASYSTLDRLQTLDAARNEPETFLKSLSKPAIIDEVQYVPDLFRYVKLYVDAHKDAKGSLLLTGSQRFHMMQGVDESMAGRTGILELLGLSLREITRDPFNGPFIPTKDYLERRHPRCSDASVWEVIYKGDLPELYTNDAMNVSLYYQSYLQTYLLRDVSDLRHVGNLAKFRRFLNVLARRHGQLLNKSDIANRLDISFQTVDRWLSILEASNIVYLLRPFSANMTKRLVKTPKLYFLNAGVAAHLCDFESPGDIEQSELAGAFLEGFVVSEIVKSFLNATGTLPTLYFYRSSNSKEIDLVIEKGDMLYPVEIKKAEIARSSDTKAFSELDAAHGFSRGEGAVVYTGSELLPLNESDWAVPLRYL